MLKRLMANRLTLSCANALMRRLQRGVTVLMYHGVVPDTLDAADGDWLQVRVSEFRDQMRYLEKHYRVVPLERAWDTVPHGKPRVALTFDDGYANNFHVAYPVLGEFGFPATIFLVTGVIGTDRLFWWDRLQLALKGRVVPAELKRITEEFKATVHPHRIDAAVDAFLRDQGDTRSIPQPTAEAYRPLNRKEIVEMAASGLICFGSHTHRHEILTHLNSVEAERTLAQSREVLKELPGRGGYFCFPNGNRAPEHIALCRRLGFDGAVLTRSGVWKDPTEAFGIPRFGIGRNTDMVKFAATLSGLLPGVRRLMGH